MAFENFRLWNSSNRGGMGLTDINVRLKNEELRKRELENERAVAPNYGPAPNIPAFTGVQPSAPPSGFGGGGGAWQEPDAGSLGYSTGLVPPGTTPRLDIPVYDQEKVEALAQRTAAPSIRKLRNEVQQVQGGVYDNPNVKAMTLRQALEGYGSGLESVVGGSLGTAAGMYGQEYQPQVENVMQNNRLASIERENRYNRAFQSWQKTGKAPGSTNARGLPIYRATTV